MIVTVLLVGHFILVQPERGGLPLQAIAALFSFQNFLLWKTTGGYWDSASEAIPLLHTWSLSVEEQFYILFPITLLLFHKIAKFRIGILIVVLFLISLLLSIVFTPIRQSAAFYLLPTRMWELLIGALVAVYWQKEYVLRFGKHFIYTLQITGLAAIILSFVFIENNKSFPGFMPLFPALGTALLLCFGASYGVVHAILSFAPIVYIGKISYSLYLWHWPILVYSKSLSLAPNIFYLSFLILGCSILSYHFIEKPLRYKTQKSVHIFLLSSLCVFLACIPLTIQKSSPYLKNLGNIDDKESLTRGYEFEATDAIVSGKRGVLFPVPTSNQTICLVGSSHARVLGSALLDFCRGNNFQLVSMATSDFGFSDTAQTSASRHASYLEAHSIDRLLEINPRLIMVAGMWSSEINNPDFRNVFAERLKKISKSATILVMGQVPMVKTPAEYENLFRKYLVALSLRSSGIPAVAPSVEVESANHKIAEIITQLNCPNILFYNPYPNLLEKNGYIKLTDNGKLLYSDNHHLNDAGAFYIFKDKFNSLLIELLKN
jgi:peptidoglycan/LPS O-acetylase OafA/YrhL